MRGGRFREADVSAFLCTHTCLPFAQRVGSGGGLLFNNGAAGLPCFGATRHGIITRVQAGPRPAVSSHATSTVQRECRLYGADHAGLHFEARVRCMPIRPPRAPLSCLPNLARS